MPSTLQYIILSWRYSHVISWCNQESFDWYHSQIGRLEDVQTMEVSLAEIEYDDFANRAYSNLYLKGDILHLTCKDGSDIRAIVNHVIQPFTYSSVMTVTLEGRSEIRAILKLFDRRSMAPMRKEFGYPEWNLSSEAKYWEFVQSGGASKFTSWLYDGNSEEYDSDKWDTAQRETYLNDECYELFKNEVTAYDAMKDIQGRYIPQLLAEVTINSHPVSVSDSQYFFEVPGVLLKYIDGFPLSSIEENVSRVSWQQICEKAVQVVNIVCDHNILNKDVRPDNMIVRADEGSNHDYEVFMIDFAFSRLRESNESDDEWRKAKWSQDEEGTIGYVMQNRLKRGFEYKPSYRYIVHENP